VHVRTGALVALGVFGAALSYGDSVITPAISVLSAVEGLEVAAPAVSDLVVPLALVILCARSPSSAGAPPPSGVSLAR
jgi:KUP system potassium uptake protein